MHNSTDDIIEYIRSEYKRWLQIISDEDEYDGDATLGIKDVLNAHFLLAEFFAKSGEGIGGLGPRDIKLLHSALSRQFVEFDGKPKWKNRIEVCATLMFGLIKNHPFHDANKRTAFLASLLHLQKIGRTPTVSAQIYEDFTVDIAENNLSKYDPDADLADPDHPIKIIARFLKRNTRDIDLRSKTITYHELETILHKYGMTLKNPKGNKIDVVKNKDSVTQTPVEETRIAHIGFHGWTKQVSKKDLHILRSAANLDAGHGYDSQSFFNGVESPLTLINKYKEPLRRLAYR